MVWNILFFVLGVFGGVMLMALIQASDMIEDYEELEKMEEIIERAKNDEALHEIVREVESEYDDVYKHIPRID